jgi:hypothetical protein
VNGATWPWIAAIAAVFAPAATANAFAAPDPVRVGVLRDGTILVDGKPESLARLDARLAAAEEGHAGVWYYREGGASSPSAATQSVMTSVLELVIKHRLPVSLSSRADYSDVINAQGRSVPRAAR